MERRISRSVCSGTSNVTPPVGVLRINDGRSTYERARRLDGGANAGH
jgi:hypothetical protein